MRGTGPFKIVRVCDPAIEDPVGPSSLRYSTSRDFSLLKFADGMTPTVFHGRLLTVNETRAVRNCATEGDKYEAAFVRGLVKVDNLIRSEGEQPVPWERPDDKSGRQNPIPDSVLEENFDPATVQEIGMVIYFKSFLARTSGGFFPLPAICRSALEANLVLRAERMVASSPSAANKTQAAAPPATPPTSSPTGAASTDATATV